MKLSNFGNKLANKSGINTLMQDLGEALSGPRRMLMLGAGNPAHVPEVQARFRKVMENMMAEPGVFERWIGNYDGPQGKTEYLEALADLFRREFGWEIGPENIVLTNGSQQSFFMLFNLFAGETNGGMQRILFPLAPEYIGYSDSGIVPGMFRANRPEIRHLDEHTFKYFVDFESLRVTPDIGAICASRPTNPTGNVLTNEEVDKLYKLAEENDIPLILDNAYGTPFPDIIFSDARPVFKHNTIVCMSLSKLGLPVTRTGIIIAREEIARAISAMNAVISLSPNGTGAGMSHEIVASGEIITISREIVKPYYKRKADKAVAQLRDQLDGTDYHIHKPEGALFLWLWFRDLPITSAELYTRLKDRGVIIVPGHYFFPGLENEEWRHKWECIRVTYAQDDAVVEEGLTIIAEEVKKAYAEGAVPASSSPSQ